MTTFDLEKGLEKLSNKGTIEIRCLAAGHGFLLKCPDSVSMEKWLDEVSEKTRHLSPQQRKFALHTAPGLPENLFFKGKSLSDLVKKALIANEVGV